MSRKTDRHLEKPELEEIISELRNSGHRITKARLAIIQTLLSAGKPLSVAQILATPNVKVVSTEKTTVYRELDFLLAERLARKVDLQDGKKRFEILRHDDHHHHLICTKCESVTCVALPSHLREIEETLEKKHKFTITSHTLEFFGTCSSCSG